MISIIWLLIFAVLFACVVYGAWVICQKFGMPQPVTWLVGAVFLVILLLFVAQQLGVGGLPPLRRP